MNYSDLVHAARPEIIVTFAALIILLLDVTALRKSSRRMRFSVAAIIGSIGCIAAAHHISRAFTATLVPNSRAILYEPCAQIAVLALTIIVLLSAIDSDFSSNAGEFASVVLLATVGAMFLVSASDLLSIFLSLELLSLSLYVLSAFDKRSPQGAEAALKYFLFGGMSAAFLLFGFSILYGLTNSLSISGIAMALHGMAPSPLLAISIVAITVGFGFKIAAAPFHFWAPDVYEAASVPSMNLIAAGSKIASFYALIKLLNLGLSGAVLMLAQGSGVISWGPILAGMAALSMVWGNFAALRQSSLRRLLAYSAVAHAGYMLIAVLTGSPAALMYYIITYAVTTVGILMVAGVVEQASGDSSYVSLHGLRSRSPLVASCLFVFVLSLAGIPPLAGFFGKFLLFAVGMHGAKWTAMLVVLALATSAVSLVYYLRVLKAALVTPAAEDLAAIRPGGITMVLIVLMALGTMILGCFPGLLLGQFVRMR